MEENPFVRRAVRKDPGPAPRPANENNEFVVSEPDVIHVNLITRIAGELGVMEDQLITPEDISIAQAIDRINRAGEDQIRQRPGEYLALVRMVERHFQG